MTTSSASVAAGTASTGSAAARRANGRPAAEEPMQFAAVRLRVPAPARTTEPALVMSAIACGVADGSTITRPQLAAATSLARSTIEANLGRLVDGGVIVEGGEQRLSRFGRPAATLALASDLGLVLIAEVTPHHVRLAVADLNQTVLATRVVERPIAEGPQVSVEAIAAGLRDLTATIADGTQRNLVLVVSVPGPVDVHRGVPVRPPIMPGWDEFPLAQALGSAIGCPVLVDNDVNLMALGESRALPPDAGPLLLVKVGTGIGGGLVDADGELLRGADGAAGDIGHVPAPTAEGVVCACGNVDCLEAVASLAAVARKLAAVEGVESISQVEVLNRLRVGDGNATRLVRDAAATIGQVVATFVHFFNPARIVLAGHVTGASDDLLAGVRSEVYRRALPLATRHLTISHSVLGAASGVVGGIVLGIESVLGPSRVESLIRR